MLNSSYFGFEKASKVLLCKWSELDSKTKYVILKDIKEYVKTCSLKYETLDNLGKDSVKHWNKILIKLQKLENLIN